MHAWVIIYIYIYIYIYIAEGILKIRQHGHASRDYI
jgi:hypothetical protein